MKTINIAIPYLHPKLPFRVSVGESGLDLAQLVIQRSSRKYRHLHRRSQFIFLLLGVPGSDSIRIRFGSTFYKPKKGKKWRMFEELDALSGGPESPSGAWRSFTEI